MLINLVFHFDISAFYIFCKKFLFILQEPVLDSRTAFPFKGGESTALGSALALYYFIILFYTILLLYILAYLLQTGLSVYDKVFYSRETEFLPVGHERCGQLQGDEKRTVR